MKDSLFDFPDEVREVEAGKSKTNELTLFYVGRKANEAAANSLNDLSTKQYLEGKYSKLLSKLYKSNVAVLLERADNSKVTEKDDIKDLEYTRKIVSLFQSSGSKLKMDWARMVAFIECDPRNLASMIDFFLNPSQKEILLELVEKKCMTIQECWKKLGYNTALKVSKYRYYFGYELPEDWNRSQKTKFLDGFVRIVTGPWFEDGKSQSKYDFPKTFYLIPERPVIMWYYTVKYKKFGSIRPVLRGVKLPDGEDLILYNSEDFISQIPVFVGMKISGLLKAGATKVPLSVGKKISAQMSLAALPNLKYTISDRPYILANLGAYARWPKKEKKSGSKKSLSDNESLLRAMSDCAFIADAAQVRYILADSLSNMTRYAIDDILFGLNYLLECITPLLHAMPFASGGVDGEWLDYANVLDYLLYDEMLRNNWPMWIHFGRYDEVGKTADITYSSVYERIKYPVINGIFQMFAAMGLLDFAFTQSEDGSAEIRYMRISNAGLWCTGRIDKLNVRKIKVDDGFHFDPDTLMVTIKDTESPNVAYLNDLAEKITPNRYKITEASLLRQCKNKAELTSRVDRLRDFVLDGQSSEKLDLLVAAVYSNVNKVKAADGENYVLVDVDSDDGRLHRFLSSNPTVRKNTLRVEGWKLLVRKSFYSVLVEKLRQEGYLIESNG